MQKIKTTNVRRRWVSQHHYCAASGKLTCREKQAAVPMKDQ